MCRNVYLPAMDLTDPNAELFYLVRGFCNAGSSWESWYSIGLLLESVPELDAVVGKMFSSVRLFVSRTSVRLF